jgi:hypothetical protein
MDLSDVPMDCIFEAYEELDKLLEAEFEREAGCKPEIPGVLTVGTCAIGLASRPQT